MPNKYDVISTFILVIQNDAPILKRFLESIYHNVKQSITEKSYGNHLTDIIIMDNCSSDKVAEEIIMPCIDKIKEDVDIGKAFRVNYHKNETPLTIKENGAYALTRFVSEQSNLITILDLKGKEI
jgi:hypothetical protein